MLDPQNFQSIIVIISGFRLLRFLQDIGIPPDHPVYIEE